MTMQPPGMQPPGGMGRPPMGRSPQPFLDAGPMTGPQSQLPPRFMAIMEQLPPELAQQIIESLQPSPQGPGPMGPGAGAMGPMGPGPGGPMGQAPI